MIGLAWEREVIRANGDGCGVGKKARAWDARAATLREGFYPFFAGLAGRGLP